MEFILDSDFQGRNVECWELAETQHHADGSGSEWCRRETTAVADASVSSRRTFLVSFSVSQKCEDVKEWYLLIHHAPRTQPSQASGWLQGSEVAPRGRCRYPCLCSSGAQVHISLVSPAKHGRPRCWCCFPWRRPTASPSALLEQIRMSGKTAIICNAVWRPKLPSCLASKLGSVLSARSRGCRELVSHLANPTLPPTITFAFFACFSSRKRSNINSLLQYMSSEDHLCYKALPLCDRWK